MTLLRAPLGRLLLIGPMALVIFFGVFVFGVSAVTQVSSPNVSVDWQPNNATALSLLAENGIQLKHDAAGLKVATEFARRSLMRDPTQARAMAVMGIAADIRGDHDKARLLVNSAASLSRRQVGTSVWLIEDAAGRGDVRAALAQYDIALRTSTEASELLFPILRDGLAEKEIRDALIEVFRWRPNWEHAFVGQAIAEGSKVEQLVPVFMALPSDPLMQASDMRQALLDRLVGQGHYALADRYYASLRIQPGGVPRNQTFGETNGLAPFDWRYGDSGVAMAVRQNGRNMLRFSTDSVIAGPIASQMVLLKPGRYRLAGKGRYMTPPGAGGVTWQVRCATGDAGTLADAPLRTSRGGAAFLAFFSVPQGCDAQWIELLIRNPDDVPIDGGIEWIRVDATE